jgi:flagellar biosynthesis protein FlhG|nr:P-loop NTPase [Kofleriaceae bacterium]
MRARRDTPRIVAIAGGKGGVGKSTIAANLALAMARSGRRVLLVDADFGAPNLHTILGVLNPARTLGELLDGRVDTLDALALPCGGGGCRFVPGMSRPGSANLESDDIARVVEAVRTADAEVVVVDVGAGASFQVLDLILAADHKLIVMTPQLTSLHNAYAMLKACVHRAVHQLTADDDTQQALVDAALGAEHKARTMVQLIEVLRPMGGDIAERISATLRGFGVGLIGNQIGNPQDAAILDRIGTMIRDHLAIRAPVLTAVPVAPTLAGGLRTRSAIDDTLPPFRRLVAAVFDVQVDALRRTG